MAVAIAVTVAVTVADSITSVDGRRASPSAIAIDARVLG